LIDLIVLTHSVARLKGDQVFFHKFTPSNALYRIDCFLDEFNSTRFSWTATAC